ncbi:MAG: extracellular solute-binding protein [Chloroflexia bacterium]|nr:extracellular solute-binding protein [Chloroflexia bacterium]
MKKIKSFIYETPYTSYPEKSFRDSFIEGAEVFLGKEGIVAFPIVVDPLVMYFNKNMLTNEGLSIPPANWDELLGLNNKLTKKENEVLKLLCLSKNRITKRDDILVSVWNKSDYFTGRSLDVFITKLRKYLKDDNSIKIEGIPTVGYVLSEE